MVNRTLARRYAVAISMLAEERGIAESVGDDLRQIADAIGGEGQIHDFFVAPVISRPDKERVLSAVFGERVNPVALHALLLLVRKRREPLLAAIVDEYLALLRRKRGAETLVLESARRLDRGEYDALVRRLEQLYGKKLEVTEQIDPALIGGVRLVMGDRRIDASISGRLDNLARELAVQ